MANVVIYARFSPRPNADKSESIEMQIEWCKEWCSKNGHTVVSIFQDRAKSGKEEDRPGLWAAVDAVKRDYILLVWKLDRLARNVYLSNILERSVTKRGGRIMSANGEGTSEENSDQDWLVRQILQTLAEYERRVIAARIKAAVHRHRANGRYCGGLVPFGYMRDPDDQRQVVENPDEQKSIARIFELLDQGLTLNKIAKQLEKEKYPHRWHEVKDKDGKVTGFRKTKWHHHMVNLIVNRTY